MKVGEAWALLKDNWRIVMLALFSLASLVALFGPLGAGAAGLTNLEYGLELSGGTRVRAPLIGMTATNVEYTQDTSIPDTRRALANDLDVSQNDIGLRPQQRTAEVYSENVTQAEFAAALSRQGFNVTESDVRAGVSEQTADEVVDTLNQKINQGGLTGGTARTTPDPTSSQQFVIVEVPNANRTEVLNLIRDRGQVELVAHYPTDQTEQGYRQVSLLTNDDFTNIGTAQSATSQQPQPHVPVSLTDDAARNYSNSMQQFGFTSEGVANCNTQQARQDPDNPNNGHCLYTVLDGQVVYAAQMSPGLAQSIESGEFERNPQFVMTTTNMTEAQQLSINLRAGALTTEMDIDDRGTTFFLQPALAQEFKFLSLLTGLIAGLAVSVVVFVRYGSPRVAVPMLATASAEIFLLLGFASAIGLAVDLSHIAGFIAVIGTGVDDLIIIADEVLQRGKVATGRVFENRFKKAFWVIGAAAATTIIAMSPLTVLSLGDLTGFAIITIVGVLLGVLVTRPAYGDILRYLMLSDEERERAREER